MFMLMPLNRAGVQLHPVHNEDEEKRGDEEQKHQTAIAGCGFESVQGELEFTCRVNVQHYLQRNQKCPICPERPWPH